MCVKLRHAKFQQEVQRNTGHISETVRDTAYLGYY